MSATATVVFDGERWLRQVASMHDRYVSASPYPHIVLDDFLAEDVVRRAAAAFPKVEDAGWIHYVHVNERKHGLNKVDLIPPMLREVIDGLNSDEFVAFLGELTGIAGLRADDMLEGGGLHQTERNGFLNVHADFTVHPHRRTWRRRVNLLLYLNDDWDEQYGGDLELWSRDMARCERSIAPLLNRVVIFNTDADSFHGVPHPLQCPAGQTRKSIALYYFTEESTPPKLRSTNYRARPGADSRMLVWADRRALAIYTSVKRTLGIRDDVVSAALQRLHRRRPR